MIFDTSYDYLRVVHEIDNIDNIFRESLYEFYRMIDGINSKDNPTEIEKTINRRFREQFQLSSSISAGNELVQDSEFNVLQKLTIQFKNYEHANASGFYVTNRPKQELKYVSLFFLELVFEAMDKLSMDELREMYEFNCRTTNYNNLYLITIKQL